MYDPSSMQEFYARKQKTEPFFGLAFLHFNGDKGWEVGPE
jgi:hypothetical protein